MIRVLCSVPEPQDFHAAALLVDTVENEIGPEQELPHARAGTHVAAALWQVAETFGLVEQAIAETFRGLRIMAGDVADDLFEIIQRER